MDKKQYQNKLEKQFNDWDQEYRLLNDMVDKLAPETDSDLALSRRYLNENRSIAENKLKKLKKSDDQKWQELREEIDEAWTNFGIALKSLREKLKDKKSVKE